MNKIKNLNPSARIEGRSLALNIAFAVLNLIGLTFLVMGYHSSNEESNTGLLVGGYSMFLLSILGLIIFKGRILMNSISRVVVGGLFIVSGLVKANDPMGFAYKLEEYFEDGALAFRIKEWFGMPEFSLEFFIQFALPLSVIICVVEIVLGVLTIFGRKMRLVSGFLLAMMLFFTFLTWHTANCDGDMSFVDRDRYETNDPIGLAKVESAKENTDLVIVSNNNDGIVIDETKQPQCVDDCGCFGDALKGSLGRSLTPSESFWKDLILLYFVLWLTVSVFKKKRVEEESKLSYVLASLLFIAFFSWVFGWVFPLIFAIINLVGGMWLFNSKPGKLPFDFKLITLTKIMCALVLFYVLLYAPIKDYRPYAVDSNLKEKMSDGIDGEYLNLLVYKNIKTDESKEFDAASKLYLDSKIWEDKAWEYASMVQKVIIAPRIPSITAQFNPYLAISDLGVEERSLSVVKSILKENTIKAIILKELEYNTEFTIALSEYDKSEYPVDDFEIVDTVSILNEELTEISLRDYAVGTDKIIILSCKNMKEANFKKIETYKDIFQKASSAGIPMIMITSSSREEVDAFRKNNNFNIPTFLNDETELKAISRSNPALLILKKGVVKGKYPFRALPGWTWINENIINK
ncbi:MAG: putative membrane protein YphA (DoxX/SURF4 family) [Lentimonas sp.]|jgi:uncharacterized membrane protein YphA (DoxX/SURF4 family)